MDASQTVTAAITNIKVAGIATMSYWSILKTADAIYFVKSGTAIGLGVGTNALFLAASVIGDVLESHRAKGTAEKDLATVLADAKLFLRFGKDQFHVLETKKGIFGGGWVKVSNGKEKSWREAGYVKLKLSRKKFKMFMVMLQS